MTDGTRQTISERRLKNLVNQAGAAKKKTSTINGELGEAVASAVENHHLNKRVFSVICRLDNMEPEALKDWLDDFEHYVEISGLRKRADAVQRLIDDREKDRDEDDTPKRGVGAGNVRTFPAAAGTSTD